VAAARGRWFHAQQRVVALSAANMSKLPTRWASSFTASGMLCEADIAPGGIILNNFTKHETVNITHPYNLIRLIFDCLPSYEWHGTAIDD